MSQTSTSGDKTTTYTANKITKITATFKLTWEHHGLQEATGWYKVTAYDENGKKLGKSILKQVDCAPKKETVREVTASTVLTERETKDNKFVYFDIELGFAEDGAGFDDTASVGAIFMRD